MKQNIIIFGGSFDPIHIGHVKMALNVSEMYNADVYFVPAKISIWKNESASKEDKLEMIRLAIEDYPRLKIDTFELDRKEDQTHSIITVRYFKEKYPDDNLYFLLGADQAASFHKWEDCLELSKLARILYYPRNDIQIPINNVITYQMEFVDAGLYQASATSVRTLNSLYIPEKVLNYIIDHDLYFVKKVKDLYTKERYGHALSVARLSIDIARSNNLLYDSLLSYFFLAGYLHDIGKKMSKEEQRVIMAEHFPEFRDLPEFAYHQFVGAYLATEIFGIDDVFILDAIKYHATGRGLMTTLEKIIYAADKIEPTRGYDSSDLIELMKQDCDKGFIEVLKHNIEYIRSTGKSTSNKLTDECIRFYLGDEYV